MSNGVQVLIDRLSGDVRIAHKAAQALESKARRAKKSVAAHLPTFINLLNSPSLNMRAIAAGILAAIGSKESLDSVMEALETEDWKTLQIKCTQEDGISDEPLYYWYVNAFSGPTGEEITYYGAELLEYIIQGNGFDDSVRGCAAKSLYFEYNELEGYRLSPPTVDAIHELIESDNSKVVESAIELLGELDETLGAIEQDMPAESDAPEHDSCQYSKADIHTAFMDRFEGMPGIEFEKFMHRVFLKSGYDVESTPATSDYGADLIVDNGKGRTAVQLKRYAQKQKVGLSAISAVVGAASHYDCVRTIAITTSSFTRSAKALAVSNQVDLWEWPQLQDFVKKSGVL